MTFAATLGLIDDDPYYLALDVQEVFGVTFDATRPFRADTMGDLLDDLRSRVATATSGPCLTSMAFYRLRAAIRTSFSELEIKPGFALAALKLRRPRTFRRQLEQRSGLRMPSLEVGWLFSIGLLALLAAIPLAVISGGHPGQAMNLAVAAGVCAVALMVLEPGRLPARCDTVGDLARRAASLNLDRLARQGGGVRDADLWPALVEIAARHSDVVGESEIGLETRLLAE